MAISITICNLALGEIRAPAIADITEDSIEAQNCARYYPQCLKLMLERYNWSFATRICALAEFTVNPRATEWLHAYALPSDMAYAKRLVPNGVAGGVPLDSRFRAWPSEWGQAYIVEAGVLYSNVQNAILEYSAIDIPEAVMPAMFTDALTYYLAARLAVPLRDSRQIKGEMLQQAEAAIHRAMADDANRQQQRDVVAVDEVTAARGTNGDWSRYPAFGYQVP
jgi:hypothetical protein